MKYFAEIDSSNIVLRVCVFGDSTTDADAAKQRVPLSAEGVEWVETFLDGGSRKNYACIGHTYDSVNDGFIEPQPFPSWVLNTTTCKWEEPGGKPDWETEGYSCWNESTLSHQEETII